MYATTADLLNAFPRTYTANFTADELTLFLDRAQGYLDAWLARRYTVPIAASPETTPTLIRQLCVDLAALDIFDRAATTPDWIIRRLERAQNLLQMLAEGTVGVPGIDESTSIGVIRSSTSDYEPIFGSIPTLNEHFDPNRVADEKGNRGDTDL